MSEEQKGAKNLVDKMRTNTKQEKKKSVGEAIEAVTEKGPEGEAKERRENLSPRGTSTPPCGHEEQPGEKSGQPRPTSRRQKAHKSSGRAVPRCQGIGGTGRKKSASFERERSATQK